MESLNVKNINDEKIFNVIDPSGQGDVANRIRPISVSINQKAETINDQTDSTINLAVYWNDTWKSILDLTFNESLRQEYGKLVEDLTTIQKDIDMKQYKDAETKTDDFLKYVANLSSKYTAMPATTNVAKVENGLISVTAEKNNVKATISDTLLNFMLRKFAKVDNLDITKANECFSTNNLSCLANHYDLYYHSPEIFQKQAYMTVVKDNKVVGSYKVNYDQFCKFASKFAITPQKLGYSKDKMAGYIKTAEVVMQNIFFDNVDEAKEWQEMVDEKKKQEQPAGEEETTEITETKTKTEKAIGEEGASESPIKEEGGLARADEGFASDEIPESEPRQQEQQGGGQNLGASRRLNLLKKKALKYPIGTELELKDGRYAIVKGRTYGAGGVETEEYVTVVIPEEDDHEEEISTEDIKNVVNVASKRKIKNTKKAKVGWNAKPENELEEKVIEIGDEIMGIDGKYSNQIVDLAFDSQDNPNKKEENDKKITDLKDKLKKEIKVVIDKNKADFTNKEFYDLFYEHLQDNNFHTANKIIEELLNGKQASKKVKLNKKAGVDITVSTGNVYTLLGMLGKYCLIQPKVIDGKNSNKPSFKLECKPEEVKEVIEKWKDPGYMYEKANKGKNLEKQAENRKNYNVVIGFDGKEEESDFAQEDVISALQEALIYFGEKWHELPSSLDNIDKLDFVKIREIEKGETVKEYTKEDILKMKEDFPKYSCNKKALYGDVQEQDIVPAKTETKVYLQSDINKVINMPIKIADVVAIYPDNIATEEEIAKYSEFIGKPMLLMETDKEDVNKVILEELEYPFQRITVDGNLVGLYDAIKGEDVVVEDVDGDEMITTFEELPIVAKQCKIKSIHKAANINKKKANLTKKAINSLEDVAGLIDTIWSDYDWYEYADALEVGETSHYENILADVQKDEKGAIEGILKLIEEDDNGYTAPEIEQLKEYYNAKFGGK